jgi:hypothetical protein
MSDKTPAQESDVLSLILNRAGASLPDAKDASLQDQYPTIDHLNILESIKPSLAKRRFFQIVKARFRTIGTFNVIKGLDPDQQTIVKTAVKIIPKELE